MTKKNIEEIKALSEPICKYLNASGNPYLEVRIHADDVKVLVEEWSEPMTKAANQED